MGQKKFLLSDDSNHQNSRHLSKFAVQQVTSFYEKFDKEEVLMVDKELERGMLVVYKYNSQRKKRERRRRLWRRSAEDPRLEELLRL